MGWRIRSAARMRPSDSTGGWSLVAVIVTSTAVPPPPAGQEPGPVDLLGRTHIRLGGSTFTPEPGRLNPVRPRG